MTLFKVEKRCLHVRRQSTIQQQTCNNTPQPTKDTTTTHQRQRLRLQLQLQQQNTTTTTTTTTTMTTTTTPSTSFFPVQTQAHFIPSGTRLAQEYQDYFSA